MKAGTMEGLIGASRNIKVANTPLRVYKDAERRGDLKVMERALKYTGEFMEEAYECKERAEEALKKEIKEEKEEAKARLEKMAEKNERQKELLEISEEGKKELDENGDAVDTNVTLEATDVKLYSGDGKDASILEETSEEIDMKI